MRAYNELVKEVDDLRKRNKVLEQEYYDLYEDFTGVTEELMYYLETRDEH